MPMAKQPEEDDLEVIMPPEDGNDDVEIHVASDVPDEDRGRPIADDHEPDGENEQEDLAVGERAKKRIDKLTAEKHAERRAKEAAVRERDEAIRLAQEAMARAQNLQSQNQQFEMGFVHTARGKAEAEMEQAQHEYQRAFEQGDSKGMAEAMQRLSRASVEKARFEGYQPPPPVQPVQYQPAPQQQPQQGPQLDREELARQTKFLRENSWFNTDQEMTERAYQLDQHVRVTQPQLVGTQDYYDFIDAMMRREFPAEKFASTAPAAQAPRRAPGQAVNPVSRAAPSGKPARRTVTLTESQVRLAKRLGLTPQQYAEQWAKENPNG